MSKFVHLHCHSEFSILECPFRVNAIIEHAKKYDMPAVALTDNASMYGAIDFYQAAKKAGINPIIGSDVYIAPTIQQKERWQHRLILLCTSFKGYQNLIQLISIAHLDGFYYKPRLDCETLAKYSEDIIAISPSGRGPIASHLQTHEEERALETAKQYQAIYGSRFYLGVQRSGAPFEDIIEAGSIRVSEALNIPIVAMNDVYYASPNDTELRDVLFCIQTGKRLDEDGFSRFENTELYFKSPEEMETLFSDRPDFLKTSIDIANQCHIEIEMEQVLLPHFKCPNNKTSEDYLEQLVWEGIDKCYPERTPELIERVNFELDIITKMKYPNYFLIIYDFLDFCEKENIPVGPGRGSAAGSIVAYALGITQLDPLKYNLLFERFLNPERISMPDIDIDFCIRRRSEVIDYIVKAYGQECVSQIITFGTMQARAVVRDVGRVLDIPLSDVDKIAKMIPASPGSYTSIPDALEEVPELKKFIQSSASFKQLISIATQLEGQVRHTSTHAAGVVISRDPLTSIVPLTQNDGQVATQFPMANIESIGLLKMDILGLRNLTVIQDAVTEIKEHHDPDFNIDTIPIDDEATYAHLCTGHGVGIFQLESRGMRQLLKDMKPQVFEDVIALLALFRPGPLGSGMVSDFISNKSGKTKVKYDIDALEPILKETYGMIVYQEQVMQIASVIGGFSLGEADMLRRAMGKKKKSVMDEMRKSFLIGAEKKGFVLSKAEHVFDLCYKFAEYGFNKSHSTAYALISYQTAYLKSHYLLEYMSALLSSVVNNSDKTAMYIQECQDLNIEVLPPDVNESKRDFTVVDYEKDDTKTKAIRFGLGAIKNVGEGAIDSIIEQAPYKDCADFCMKVDLKQCNKRVVESLVKSGAMDRFEERSYLLAVYESIIEKAQVRIRERSNGQVGLFADNQVGGGFSVQDIHTDDYRMLTHQEKLRLEKELLGLYISGHPLDPLKEMLSTIKTPINALTDAHHGQVVSITGLLTQCRRITTRNNREMCSGQLEDLTGSMSIIVFYTKDFEQIAGIFNDEHIVKATGKCKYSEHEKTLVCTEMTLIDRTDTKKSFYIDVNGLDNTTLAQIQQVCFQCKGAAPLYFKCEDKTIMAHEKYWIAEDSSFRDDIEQFLGRGRVWVV